VTASPDPAALDWALRVLGSGARVTAARGMRQGGNPWLLELDGDTGRRVVLKTAAPGSAGFATEIAALRLAAEHQIPAPRLLGVDPTGAQAGTPAVLETAIPGTSRIPATASTQRLLAIGVAAAALSTVAIDASAQLPPRQRPIPAADFAQERRLGQDHSTPLLAAADELAARLPMPDGARTLVHGDIWQGNMIWLEDELQALIDWDMAGVGHPGIDLSALRLDAALMFGPPAADVVLRGWEQHTGAPADQVPYWDLIAAVNQPGDMVAFEPVIQDQGRPDLDAALLARRRDDFLRSALAQLS
jgi:aminoglycoside phosphotransferase (APT) family kinase protein